MSGSQLTYSHTPALIWLLMAGCIALGYLIAQGSTIEPGLAAKAAAGNVFDAKRTEGRAVIDRIGDLSGRLIRLLVKNLNVKAALP